MMQREDSHFFKFPNPLIGIPVALLMVVFGLTVYYPDCVVFDYMGSVGEFCRFMNKEHFGWLRIIQVTAILMHVGETMLARKMCKRNGLTKSTTYKWMIQTFIMGFPSLLRLRSYKPDRKIV